MQFPSHIHYNKIIQKIQQAILLKCFSKVSVVKQIKVSSFFADFKGMKDFKKISALCFFVFYILTAFAYPVKYKEQFYELYHVHHTRNPDDFLENIYWLERAVEADFCNPLYAFAKIENETQWQKYRAIFMAHLNLKLAEQHLRLGSQFDKQVAYFYNAPWKEQNIESLQVAESYYYAALEYWKEAKLWAEQANIPALRFVYLRDLKEWEEDIARIKSGDLNYERTIRRELKRLEKVRQEFTKMDETTY